jgi:mannitol-1-phosphate 5-dehydrogenase
VHNAGHASAAYLGYIKHLEYVWEAMQDPRIRPIVDGAMAESCEGLHRKYSLPLDELHAHAEDLKRRFQNKALGDQVVRVAADPLRKLGNDDRLIGAIKMCSLQKVVPESLAMATAAALLYDNPDDPGAMQLHAMWRDIGPEGILRTVCGLSTGSSLARLVLKQATKVGILARW